MGVAGRGNNSDDYEAFVSETGVEGFTHLIDSDGDIWSGFEIPTQPSWIALNEDGEVVERRTGALGVDGIGELAAGL